MIKYTIAAAAAVASTTSAATLETYGTMGSTISSMDVAGGEASVDQMMN